MSNKLHQQQLSSSQFHNDQLKDLHHHKNYLHHYNPLSLTWSTMRLRWMLSKIYYKSLEINQQDPQHQFHNNSILLLKIRICPSFHRRGHSIQCSLWLQTSLATSRSHTRIGMVHHRSDMVLPSRSSTMPTSQVVNDLEIYMAWTRTHMSQTRLKAVTLMIQMRIKQPKFQFTNKEWAGWNLKPLTEKYLGGRFWRCQRTTLTGSWRQWSRRQNLGAHGNQSSRWMRMKLDGFSRTHSWRRGCYAPGRVTGTSPWALAKFVLSAEW